jgi:hypothetical protein
LDTAKLTEKQAKIMAIFYGQPKQQVVFRKLKRTAIWQDFRDSRKFPTEDLSALCPALLAELNKAESSGNLVQPAVFSECVYAQALASMLGLENFSLWSEVAPTLSDKNIALLSKYGLKPRYIYNGDESRWTLAQAGGSGGVDCAIVNFDTQEIFMCEFKEPGAKTTEPDLPKYGEDGFLISSTEFEAKHPQFTEMLQEKISGAINFWDVMGTNVHGFSLASVEKAISENYAGEKFADVICVEDTDGYLTMLPADQVQFWAEINGEIRPGGKNAYTPWTPKKLQEFIKSAGGSVIDANVVIPKSALKATAPKGGTGISRYKLNSIFFVRAGDVRIVGGEAYFKLSDVRQVNPTISAHMFFNKKDKKLKIAKVHDFYRSEF